MNSSQMTSASPLPLSVVGCEHFAKFHGVTQSSLEGRRAIKTERIQARMISMSKQEEYL